MQQNSRTSYTDYTPDLSSLNDLPRQNVGESTEAVQTKKTRKGKSPRKKNEQPEAKKENPVKKSAIKMPDVKGFFTGTAFRLIAGIFLGCIGVYLLVAFLSYMGTCIHDQSLINSAAVGSLPPVENAGGEGGARLSEFLINECFGLGSFVIVLWLLAMSLKVLVGKPRFKALNFTIKCFIILLTVSLIVGLSTIASHTSVNWGGYHGRYVNEFIIGFVGWSGAVLLSIFMLSLFVAICLRDMVKWIVAKYRIRRERLRREAAERAEQRAREEEIERMQRQETIDDIKAGETAVLPEASPEIIDDRNMAFENLDAPLYEMSDDPALSDSLSTEDAGAENGISKIVTGKFESDEDSDMENAGSIEEIADETENFEAEESPDDDTKNEVAPSTMQVLVNHIGEAKTPHFKSEVDLYESHKYKFPPYDLLNPGQERKSVDKEEQMENQQKIEKTLLDFGIPITKISATVGPTVTLYEIVPDKGVKIAKIRSLVDDIALSLAAKGVRIIAPIPGKGTVGIEVANRDPETVSMRTVIKSTKYQETKYALPIALGSTISNEVYIKDLAKMPHLLVGGATGQGKSVGLNAIIASLVYSKAPWQLKFVMIDPKMVEFSLYNKLRNYYMATLPGEEDKEPVITDMKRVEAVLSSLCVEMDNRYKLLKVANTRNLEEYNNKIKEGRLNPAEGHRFLPYIVVIVDEFGDLVMVAGKSVEMPIARLAQKARAVGMHVIIATQRPSTNVITGIIKANFPARISFKVSSGVDSKTILDSTGAQQLIGRGDMLIFNDSEMVRVQCAFIDTPEVEAICDYVSKQPYPTGPYILPEPETNGEGEAPGEVNMAERDNLFDEVARAIVGGQQPPSTTSVQRTYAMGYSRAGRIMDQLERAGIIGPTQGAKPRAILMSPSELEDFLSINK